MQHNGKSCLCQNILQRLQKGCLLPVLILLSFSAISQEGVIDLSAEFQAYPTGLIPGVRIEKGFGGKNAVHLRLGYQLIDHRDLGEHLDETGSGYGFSLGYKRYVQNDYEGLFLGLRNDLWFNEIDWRDLDGGIMTSGTSEITVIQPTAEAGWLWPFGTSWIFSPTLAFGVEVNVQTEGEPTGEGLILLLGIQLGRRF